MQEILNEIVPIIAEKLGVDPSEVTMEASFTNDLGAKELQPLHPGRPTRKHCDCW